MRKISELLNKIHSGEIFAITEWCPNCGQETDIWSEGVSACQHCGKPLLPCSMCDMEEVDYCHKCPYEKFGGAWNDNGKRKVTMPNIKYARL